MVFMKKSYPNYQDKMYLAERKLSKEDKKNRKRSPYFE